MKESSTVRSAERLFVLGLAASVAAILLFAWLARGVLEGATFAFDTSIRMAVHRYASPGLTEFMRVVTRFGAPWSLIVLGIGALFALLGMHWKRAAALFAVTMCGAFVLDVTLKLSFQRARPAPFFGYPVPESYSFPSGHALFSVCFFGVLASFAEVRVRSRALRTAIWFVAVASILLVGLSRIYLGVHYPSDVLAGYAAAVIWVSAAAHVDRLLRRRARRGSTQVEM